MQQNVHEALQAQNPPKGVEDIYRDNFGDRLLAGGIAAFFVFIGCADFIFHNKDHPSLSIVIGAIWVLGIPMYFFLEHIYFFKNWGKPDQYDQFTRLQDLAAKVWAGVVLVLTACYLHEFPHGG